MLGNRPFYHSLLRRYVTIFGSCFDDIWIVRKDRDTGDEVQRVKVPITYAPKDSIMRQFIDPTLLKDVAITLPRMSFDISSISYSTSRKQNSLLKVAKANTNQAVASSYMPVPYDITFDLYVYSKYIDEANQIIEQILPFFHPTFTPKVEVVPELSVTLDIPIHLNSVDQEIDYETDYSKPRMVRWTLRFTLQGLFFGPVTTPKIIRTVYANIWRDGSLNEGGSISKINVSGGSGFFRKDDFVYQGRAPNEASAAGYVIEWEPRSNTTGLLTLGAVQGDLKTNVTLHAVSTNAAYTLESFDVTPINLVEIKVQPDPLNAEPTDDYGYTVTITEWPDANN